VRERTIELAVSAARLVVEEGLEYAAAKRKAARAFAPMRVELPSNEAVEQQVREHLALFHADTQAAELRALRCLALRWMRRLQEFRPHLAGAVWRGTATRLSAIHIDLFADDPKSPEIALVNLRIVYDASDGGRYRRREPYSVLSVVDQCPELKQRVALHLSVHDHDSQRGALMPDPHGRTWRGDLRGVQSLVGEIEP
jgi:hypothetical protein